jgi:hypothetical protein
MRHVTAGLILTAGLLATSPAAAGSWGVDVEFGLFENSSSTYDFFADGIFMTSVGLRGQVPLIDPTAYLELSVIGGWHGNWSGARVDSNLESPDGGWVDQDFHTSFSAQEFTVGPKLAANVRDIFYPYVALQGLMMTGSMALDDDIDSDDNAGEFSRLAVTGGLVALGGMEFQIPVGRSGVSVSLFTEAGYGYAAPWNFSDFGQMQAGGLVLRTGAGIRF